MPFNFKAYDEKCCSLTVEELQREWQHYTRLITGAATSTSISGLALPFTLGISGVGVAMSAPAIHNARKKRAIIEKHLMGHNEKHVTRKRDVLGSVTVSGAIGAVTLGASSFGAEAIAVQGAEHGISSIVENGTAVKVATHAAMDGVGMAVEHIHTDAIAKKEATKAAASAGVFQAVADAKAAKVSDQSAYNRPCSVVANSSSSQSLPPPYCNHPPDLHIQSLEEQKQPSDTVAQDIYDLEDYLPPPYPPPPPRPATSVPITGVSQQYHGNKAEQWYAQVYAPQQYHPSCGLQQLPVNGGPFISQPLA